MKTTLVCGAVVVLLAVSAEATPILFTYEGSNPHSYEGTLDGNAFEWSSFVITAVGDTDDRQKFQEGWGINHISSSISIEGLGDFEFLSGTHSFVNNVKQAVGLSRAKAPETGAPDLLGRQTHSLFATWDMLDSIGPVEGRAMLMQWEHYLWVDTTGGILIFDDNWVDVTFTATIVPEPTTILFLGLGGLMLGKKYRR